MFLLSLADCLNNVFLHRNLYERLRHQRESGKWVLPPSAADPEPADYQSSGEVGVVPIKCRIRENMYLQYLCICWSYRILKRRKSKWPHNFLKSLWKVLKELWEIRLLSCRGSQHPLSRIRTIVSEVDKLKVLSLLYRKHMILKPVPTCSLN